MSRAHIERSEYAVEAARERAKDKLRVLQLVLVHWAEGLSSSVSAERLEMRAVTVRKYRSFLGLRWNTRDVGAGLRRESSDV